MTKIRNLTVAVLLVTGAIFTMACKQVHPTPTHPAPTCQIGHPRHSTLPPCGTLAESLTPSVPQATPTSPAPTHSTSSAAPTTPAPPRTKPAINPPHTTAPAATPPAPSPLRTKPAIHVPTGLPTPPLANTGTSTGGLLATAIALLVGGSILIGISRKRSAKSD